MLDAVLLSDAHLGSDLCLADRLQKFLDNLPETERLVLVGDVLDSMHTHLPKSHWRILRKLSKLSNDTDVVWVKGNHDWDAQVVAELVGAFFTEQYVFTSGKERICCIHGHQWDEFLEDHPWLTAIGDFIYGMLQKLDKSHRWAIYAKQNSKHFLRCAEKIHKGALTYAEKHGFTYVIVGHTHQAYAPYLDVLGGPLYLNLGTWAELPGTYATVKDGAVRLEVFDV